MTEAVYRTSPIRRRRATKAEVEARREALLSIVDDGRPMTVRQAFYQATVRGLIEKAESGYDKVQNDLTVMRRDGSTQFWATALSICSSAASTIGSRVP